MLTSFLAKDELLIQYSYKEKPLVSKMNQFIYNQMYSLGHKSFLIQIKGLDYSVEEFLYKIQSTDYVLEIADGSLYRIDLLSENVDDLLVFNDFIGTFDEGYMSISFLSQSINLKNSDALNCPLNLDNICLLEIDILNTGNSLRILFNENCKVQNKILDWLYGVTTPHG